MWSELVETYEKKKLLLDIKWGGEHMEDFDYCDEFFRILKPLQDHGIPDEEKTRLGLENWF